MFLYQHYQNISDLLSTCFTKYILLILLTNVQLRILNMSRFGLILFFSIFVPALIQADDVIKNWFESALWWYNFSKCYFYRIASILQSVLSWTQFVNVLLLNGARAIDSVRKGKNAVWTVVVGTTVRRL